MLVEYLDDLWIVELKDREFGAGDAYAFNYRRFRYSADKAFVITTDKVSPDAQQVLREYSGEPANQFGPLRKKVDVELIEGLDKVESVLQREVQLSAIRYAVSRTRLLDRSVGFDLAAVLVSRFGFSFE